MATLLNSESSRLYSWWWDSHISPKNSKWLQENLTDMDAKVKAMIKLIEEDADSFARRAEMYYKKRPELMKLVEEFYRAYRALAERYNHATGELRQAHRTMAEAFPNQVPFILAEDSPSGSSAHESEPHTPEMPHPICALLDPDYLNKDVLGLSASNFHAIKRSGPYSEESDATLGRKGLKQLNEMFAAGEIMPHNSKFAEGRMRKGLNHETEEREGNFHDEVSQLSFGNQNLKARVLSESEHTGKAESEVKNLKKALANMQAEKEAILLQYKQSLEKLSELEGELNCAQKDFKGLDEQVNKAETEVQTLKEALVKSEAERDAGFLRQKEYLERISNLESMVCKAQEEAKGLNGQAIKAETEAQYLREELLSLEAEKEVGLLQYKQCVEKISDLENKLVLAEEEGKVLSDRADRAETEVKKLRKALAELNEVKEAAALQYEQCLEKISMLEREISCAQEDVKCLNSEILMAASKLKDTEEKCVVLETSNQSLRLEADNLAKTNAVKDEELLQKHEELEKLKICVQDEHFRFVQIETTLQALQNLHCQSQEEQRTLALELKNGLQKLNDLQICKQGLKEEICKVKDENQSLNELNLSSTVSMQNMQSEIHSLREIKERLEEEVELQMGQSNTLQQEIYNLKQEIKGLNQGYQALMEELESVGLSSDCIGSSVKDLRDENSKLRQICDQDKDEKEALFMKLENMEKLKEKNAILESSMSDVNGELEVLKKKVKALQESSQFLHGERSTLLAEKASLLSQLQIVTENMQKLLDKNTIMENSLSGANLELEGLREKSKSLEELCQLLNNEKSNLLTERRTLSNQLENIEQRLENLEKRFTELEERYAGLEKEKESTVTQVEELRVSLGVEKQERASFTLLSEARLASLANHIHLLQEEGRWRKKDLEEELDKAVKAQFEVFILQKFLQDLEEKNYSLLIECQKHAEASKLTEKLISELESENLEQQVEAELLLDEIEKLRMGIFQVFKAFEIGPDTGYEEKIENEKISVHHVLRNIEDMKCSLAVYKDDKEQLWVENSVLQTLLGELKLEGSEIESQKEIVEQELKTIAVQLEIVQNEKHELLEMNRQLRSEVCEGGLQVNKLEAELEHLRVKQGELQRDYLELQERFSRALEENSSLFKKFSDLKEEKCTVEDENNVILRETLSLSYLSIICESYGTEKAVELNIVSEDLHNLHGVKSGLEKEVSILRRSVDMKETENFLFKDSLQKLEKELHDIREIDDLLKKEMSSGKEFLKQKETELSEAEQKLEGTKDSNLELCRTVEGLKKECKKAEVTREYLEKKILVLSEDNMRQNTEIACLHQVNGKLESELVVLHQEIEEHRIREENLSSELQERSNEFELWEAEAATFYFDLQISAVREVLLENKVYELAGVCKTLEDESVSKNEEIEQMKERVSLMESEIDGLKGQLFAYAPLVVSLRDNVASLEQNTLFWTKLIAADNQEPKVVESAFHLHGKSCQESMEDLNSGKPNGISDLQELQAKIKAVEKLMVEEMERLTIKESLKANMKLEAATKEIEELKSKCSLSQEKDEQEEERQLGVELSDSIKVQKAKPKIPEVRNGTLMKDIPLDQVSDGSLYKISRRGSSGADDQMLELWETAEEDRSIDHIVNESRKQAYAASAQDHIVYHQFEDVKRESEDHSSELQVEKELGVDKLEVSKSVAELHQGGKKREILETLASDAQKLTSLQTTVQDLRRKLETKRSSKRAKDVDVETMKEQLQEVEESVVQLVRMNSQLMKDVEESPSSSNGEASVDIGEVGNVQRKRVLEQAREGSGKIKIERLQLEIQKIQYVLLKSENEKEDKGRNRFSSMTSVVLRDFIHRGKESSERRRKSSFCGCFQPSTGGHGSNT